MIRLKIILLLALFTSSLHAYENGWFNFFQDFGLNGINKEFWPARAEIDVTAGYRHDSHQFTFEAEEPPPSFLFSQDFDLNNIRIPTIGMKGRIEGCCPWFIKGWLETGSGHSGKWKSEFINAVGHKTHTHDSITHAAVLDSSVAIGYWFQLSENLFLTPEVGWAYDSQKFKMRGTRESYSSSSDDLKYHTSWKGAWLGLECKAFYRCYDFLVGYEYHLPKWEGRLTHNEQDSSNSIFERGFSTDRAYGNILYCQVGWQIFSCFYTGLEFKYQYWKAKDAKHHSSEESYLVVELERDIWKSANISLDLRYLF